jgi:hypothetical protein
MGALASLEIPKENRKVEQIQQAFLYNILEGVHTVQARKKKERGEWVTFGKKTHTHFGGK